MRKLYIVLFLFVNTIGIAQEDAWIYFNDKPSAATYLANPLSMLTQRALDRRTAQGIALDVSDVPVEPSYINQVTASSGITVLAKSKWLNCLHIQGSQSDINALLNLSFVHHIEFANSALNLKTAVQPVIIPQNKQLDVAVNFNYGNSLNQVQMLGVDYLHQNNYTGQGKIIAVLDSGFINVNTATSFQRMYTNGLFLGGYNYVSGDTNIYSLHNHGTMTLSCMVGYTDGQLVGTAPDAQYYLYVTEDVSQEMPIEESYWVEAAEEADRVGADVISTSLGYFQFDNTSYGHTYSDMTGDKAFASRGANIAFSKGMIVLASAGNSGASSEPHVGVPAEATNVIAVGAVDSMEQLAFFSSIGPSFDGRIKPDLMAKGMNATVAYTDGSIGGANGTSFSCPILAGAVTSFWSAFPSLTNQQIVDLVKQSADRYTNPNNQYGYGIPDFQQAVALSTQNNGQMNLYLYPNPSQDFISVEFKNGFEQATFELYDIVGKRITSQNLNQVVTQIPVTNLQAGTYLYKISGNSSSKTGKIIKQ